MDKSLTRRDVLKSATTMAAVGVVGTASAIPAEEVATEANMQAKFSTTVVQLAMPLVAEAVSVWGQRNMTDPGSKEEIRNLSIWMLNELCQEVKNITGA